MFQRGKQLKLFIEANDFIVKIDKRIQICYNENPSKFQKKANSYLVISKIKHTFAFEIIA